MKRIFFTSMVLFFISNTSLAQDKKFLENIYHYIEDPGMFAVNQEKGHVPLVAFTSKEDALSLNWNKSNDFQLLNGQWKFKWFETPDVVPKDFYERQFKDIAWDDIKVPCNWEMEGFGDPVFRNISQPFRTKPPFVPHDYNPTGAYRKMFTVPANWKSKEIFLRVEAATSASFLWINGMQLGFNEGANEPAEYNITKYLVEGENIIAICVTKYSAGTYLEDQDMWRLAGIFRDVYLYAVPKTHIRDYYVATDLDQNYQNAQLNISTEIKNYATNLSSDYSIRTTLFDVDRRSIIKSLQSEKFSVASNRSSEINLSANIPNPKKWSPEYPNLYYVTFELIDSAGVVKEVLADRIGFKKVEVKHQAILVNGTPVKLNGVNSHMQHPDLGHSMDTATIRKDLTLMKQFNINLVRTSHYPPNIDYLRMADEIGMFIVDETGDESHATEYISTLPEWTAAYVDRVRGMVLRDRNHPSIIFWSAGNESGIGNNICEVIKEGKRLDSSRIFMYGGNTNDVAWKNEVPCEDIIGPRYPTPYELKTRIAEVPESQDPRPSFMDEYVAATGNGAGGLDEYWDLIYQYPRLSGGAIWDFVSPGIRESIRLLSDESKSHINVAVKGRGQLVNGKFNKAISLNGHDQWIDVYRDPSLDITGKALTLSLWVYPNKWNGDNPLITKGSFQFGLNQFTKDSLEMYVSETEKECLKVALPDNWEMSWHHVAGIYDGRNIAIYIDGKLRGQQAFEGSITNKPFPISLGHFSDEDGQEFPGYQSNSIFDRVAVFNKVIPIIDLMANNDDLKSQSLLWLDMDEVQEKGDYFSMGMGGRTYGLVWPDRTPQPELYQLKKSAQPVKVSLLSIEDRTLEVWNRYHFTNLDKLKGSWQLFADDKIIDQGVLKLSIEPLQKQIIKIPFRKPSLQAGVEYRLLINFALKNSTPWASSGFVVAWDQIELPWKKEVTKLQSTEIGQKLIVKQTGDLIFVAGKDFEYSFNKQTGTLSSLKYYGQEFIKQGPKLNVWRPPLANDYDLWTSHSANLQNIKPGLGAFPAGGWYSYGLDQLSYKLDKLFIATQDNYNIVIVVDDHAQGINYRTAFDNHFVYTITADGKITIDHTATPQGLMPNWLPKIGLQWVMDKSLNNVIWYGRGPFENYPDRKTGAAIGIYKNTVEGFKEDYLIPQDYGCRTDNRWVKLESKDGIGLQISGSHFFNFSAQNCTTDNMSRARYNYQLLPMDGFTFSLDYATSGVGCTAISVLDQYRVSPQVYHFKTYLKPYKN